MSNRLYLFVDTNLFIQCKPLDELDWSRWEELSEIHLIVSRPIQAEIDFQKNRGADRVGKRARRTSGIFREIISAETRLKTINASSPLVQLVIRHELKPDPSLADQLSYDSRDDQLVGIAYAFAQSHVGEDVRVLTHDTGPMYSADMVGLKFIPIPDEWLLEPETTESDRRALALQTEVNRLKKDEPNFIVEFADSDGKTTEKFEGEVQYYPPLSDDKISQLLQKIRERFPEAVSFEKPLATEAVTGILASLSVTVPISEGKIFDYKREYLKWLDECEKALKTYHSRLNYSKKLSFKFLISNSGIRPGTDALITLKAAGNFLIDVPKKVDASLMPHPPVPSSPIELNMFGAMDQLMNRDALKLPPLPTMFEKPRNPNGFYYVSKPVVAVSEFSFECKQWRHGLDAESFHAVIRPDGFTSELKGAVSCEVRAANLSQTASGTIPVRFKFVAADTFEEALSKVN